MLTSTAAQQQTASFEKDRTGKLINFNETYLTYLGADNEKEFYGLCEAEIAMLKPFYKMYTQGEQEARILRRASIQKEFFYFEGEGKQPVITTRFYCDFGSVEIRGSFFKVTQVPVTWDGKKLVIWNFFNPVRLSLFKFYVLTLKCRGYSNHEIANRTFRAESTIRSAIQELYCLFNVYDFMTLARYYDLGDWLNSKTIKLLSDKFS